MASMTNQQHASEAPPPVGAGAPAAKPVLTPKQAKRANATVIGMLIALGLSLAVVLPVLLLNPTHTAETYQRDIDVQEVSAQATDVAGYQPLAPGLPAGWTSNFARWNAGGTDGVPYWEVGYLTPEKQFIQLTQTDSANPTWLAQRTGQNVSGTREVAGTSWKLLDNPSGDTVLLAETGAFTLILNGTADLAEFDVLAAAATEELASQGGTGESPKQ
jgi:hypothetical protein